MDVIFYLIVVFVGIIAAAFFSAAETALLRLSSHQIQEDIKKHLGPAVAAVKELLRSLSRLLVTILLGSTIVSIFATAAASALCVHYFGNEHGVLISGIIMTVLVLLFGELLPKAIAAKSPKKVSYIVALPLYFMHKILIPIHLLFERLIDPIVNKIVGGSSEENQAYDTILMLARQMKAQSRQIGHQGSALPIIGSTARAAEMTAGEIMIPRVEIFAAESTTKASELLDRMLKEHYTRVPVYQKSLDQVLGIVHIKDLIIQLRNQNEDIQSIIKPVLRIPERRLIFSILAEMQKGFTHVAIVKDQHGNTLGLLTQEDILEEIVGEIRDEFDKEELNMIQKIGDHSYIVLGRTLVHDFNVQTGWAVKSQKGDSMGGLVFNILGRAPRLGDNVTIGEYEISVSDVSGSRITRVYIRKKPDEKAQGEKSSTN